MVIRMGFYLPCVTVNANAGMLQDQVHGQRVYRVVHKQAVPTHQRGDSAAGILVSRRPHDRER